MGKMMDLERSLSFQVEVPGRSERSREGAGRMLGRPPKGWYQHLGLDRDLAAPLLVPWLVQAESAEGCGSAEAGDQIPKLEEAHTWQTAQMTRASDMTSWSWHRCQGEAETSALCCRDWIRPANQELVESRGASLKSRVLT